VNSDDDVDSFEAKLEGAYDWMGPAQAGFRRLKNLGRSSAHVLRNNKRQDVNGG
jgi:hypothetical protein